MTDAFRIVLDSASVRRAAAEGVSETVIAAIYLLHERSVADIVAKLRPGELEQVIKLVERCPSCYPPGTLEALKAGDKRRRRRRSQASPLHGPRPALRTCAEPKRAGSHGSTLTPLGPLPSQSAS
jgi:hypothetical protein